MGPMAPSKLTREQKKAQTRERLLDAATQVFANKGYAAASLDEIAEEAGLTKGAVYSNFDSKDDLFVTLLEERVDPRMIDFGQEVGRDVSGAEQALEAGELYMRELFEERTWVLITLEYRLHAARNPEVLDRWVRRSEEMVKKAAAIIVDRADVLGNDLPMTPEELARGFFALTDGFSLLKLTSVDFDDALLGKMFALIEAGLEAQPGQPSRAKGPQRPRSRR